MNLSELKEHLHNIIQTYFGGATVAWAEQKIVKPTLPLITLKLDSLTYPLHSIKVIDSDESTGYIPSSVRLEVQLFTEGEEKIDDEGDKYIVNTAMSDMMDFVNYINSDYVLDICDELDIAIRTEGPIQDISALLNDTRYEFRAMQDFFVSFTQTSAGKAGISRLDWQQTPSGGGTAELADMQDDFIENDSIEIIDEDKEEII